MIQDNPVWYSSEIPGHHTAFGSGLQASGIPSAGFPDTAGPLRAKARTRNRTALFFLLQTHKPVAALRSFFAIPLSISSFHNLW
jgi:hypothetical protein